MANRRETKRAARCSLGRGTRWRARSLRCSRHGSSRLSVPSAHSGFLELFAFVAAMSAVLMLWAASSSPRAARRARWRSRRSFVVSLGHDARPGCKRLPGARRSTSGYSSPLVWFWGLRDVHGVQRAGSRAAGGMGARQQRALGSAFMGLGRGRGCLRPGGGSAGLGRRARPVLEPPRLRVPGPRLRGGPRWQRRARSSGSSASSSGARVGSGRATSRRARTPDRPRALQRARTSRREASCARPV